MLAKKIQDVLNKQINEEMYSSYLYLQMSAWFTSINLPGFAQWMRVQSQEETLHAMKLFDYILSRGGKVLLSQIKTPPAEWKSPLGAFQAAYKHEKHITGCFDKLTAQAEQAKDNATKIFLQWFINEQVEEEASTDEIVQKLKLIKDSLNALFMLDNVLGQRSQQG